MIGLVATVAVEGWPRIIAVGLAFIAVGALIQYRVQLELDDRRDAAEQDRDAIVDAVLPRIPEQRQGGAQ